MRLRLLAASVPAALLTLACDGVIAERTATPSAVPAVLDLGRPTFDRQAMGNGDDVRWISRPGGKLGREVVTDPPSAPEPGAPSGNGDACVDTITSAFAAIDMERDLAAGGCNSDAECVVEFAPTGCGGFDIYAVTARRRDGFLDAIAKIDKNLCDTLDPECPIAMPSIFGTPVATCQATACQLDFVAPVEPETCNATGETRDTAEGCVSCGLAADKAIHALYTVVGELAACEVDSDCVHVTDDTGCGSSCGVAINGDNVDAYQAARSEIQADWCTGGTCPIFMAGCTVQEPKCNAGRCELVGTW